MTAARTPTPWAAFSDGNHTNIVAVTPHTKCVLSLPGRDKREADIEFIVRACNGWDNIDALRARLAELEGSK